MASKEREATKQVESLKAALESEKTTAAWTNEKLQEANGKLTLSDRNLMSANGQIQELQVYYMSTIGNEALFCF